MRKLALIGLICFMPLSVMAEEPLPPPDYDGHPAVENNTGPVSTGSDAIANIQAETGGSGSSTGALDGELTVFYDGTSVKVYSGLNKVEVIPEGSDGWVGRYTIETGNVKFQPAGRPQLDCMQQTGAPQWYGPCKLPEVEGS